MEPTDESKAELQRLVEKLKKDNDALVSEFSDEQGSEDNDVDSTQAVLRELSKGSVDAIKCLNQLIAHSESDAVRASCSKYILDWRLGLKVPTTPAGDGPLADLVAGLRKQSKPVNDGE